MKLGSADSPHDGAVEAHIQELRRHLKVDTGDAATYICFTPSFSIGSVHPIVNIDLQGRQGTSTQ